MMTTSTRIIRPAIALLIAAVALGALATMAPVMGHTTDGTATTTELTPRQTRRLARPLAQARAATAKYATNLELAKADGYTMMITQMIPDMGYHFLNPDITEFDVTKPPILVYVRNGDDWQLVGFEWVFPKKPETRPLPGARYASFPAACHYEDGLFVFGRESSCTEQHPDSGAAFTFWHPKLITLHVWAWYPNPAGLFTPSNRWIRPFNDGQV